MTETRRDIRFRRSEYLRVCAFSASMIVFLLTSPRPSPAQAASTSSGRILSVEDISPDQSSLEDTDPDGASGGRVSGLAVVKGDLIAYAASEWGGLFKSKDGGLTWTHLDGHLPSATWRVKVDPTNGDRVYATSFYDGRVKSVSGISISEDGGVTWTHPATAVPPNGFCKNPDSRLEFSAFGIGINPVNPSIVYVGTACGIAMTVNRGLTWTFVDPSSTGPADTVWDVLAHANGIVDSCGADGHSRSVNSGKTWAPTNSLPSGMCSLAGSPDEDDVLFAVVSTQPYESDDGGLHWSTLENPAPQGRIPFVKTNKRTGAGFDLWFGDVTLYRIPCSTPTGAGNKSVRCPAVADQNWQGPFTRQAGGHDDTGDIAFSTTGASAGCPMLFASDGGVYLNTVRDSPGCQDPKWRQPDITPHGLWLLTLDGASALNPQTEDLYIGNQDDGTFGTREGLATHPSWVNSNCCDSPLLSASISRVLYASCCYRHPPYRFNQLYVSDPGLSGGAEINNYPAGDVPGWEPRIVAQFGPSQYAVITSAGIFTTPDITSKPIVWNALGASNTPDSACAIYVSTSASGVPMFFVQTTNCDGRGGSQIYRLQGIDANGQWQALHKLDTNGSFGVFAVGAHNPLRLMASYMAETGPRVAMVSSDDGGGTWHPLTALDAAMTQNGSFEYVTKIGPTDSTTFAGYPQPTLVAFDPEDDNVIVAAGADSGLFLSADKGSHWEQVRLKGRSMYRARAVRFSHSKDSGATIFAGSEGAGVWRIALTK